jgi:hypothetical protein
MKLKTTFEGLENIGWVTSQEACGYIHTSHILRRQSSLGFSNNLHHNLTLELSVGNLIITFLLPDS